MQIDWGQVVPWLLAALGMLLGTWSTVRRVSVEASAKQQITLADLAAKQHTLLEQMREDNLKREAQARLDHLSRNQELYVRLGTISSYFQDIRNGEVNIYNTLRGISRAQGDLHTSLGDMPRSVAKAVVEATVEADRESIRLLGAELVASIKEYLSHEILDRGMYKFPDADDPRWREEFIIPVVPEAVIHKDHRFTDDVKLNKPCATIKPEGESVMLMEAEDLDCLMVRKPDCWGYLPRYTVKIVSSIHDKAN